MAGDDIIPPAIAYFPSELSNNPVILPARIIHIGNYIPQSSRQTFPHILNKSQKVPVRYVDTTIP